ncbi:MAG: phosphoribosyltransferase family protein [Dehalococcoidia bacterium]
MKTHMEVSTLSARPIETLEALADLVKVSPRFKFLEDELVGRLFRSGCILKGHFRLQSLQHSDVFLRFRTFASNPENLSWVANHLAQALRQNGDRFDVIVAPDTAGGLLADAIAEAANLSSSSLTLKTDLDNRVTTSFVGDSVRNGDRALLVNDILTTGEGVHTARTAVEQAGGEVVSLALFANRAADPFTTKASGPFPAMWLFTLDVKNYGEPWSSRNADQCPECLKENNDFLEARLLN